MEIDSQIKEMLHNGGLYYGTYKTLGVIVNNIITTYNKQQDKAAEVLDDECDMEP